MFRQGAPRMWIRWWRFGTNEHGRRQTPALAPPSLMFYVDLGMSKQVATSEIEPAEDLNRRQLLRGSLGFAGVLPLCCRTPEIRREGTRYDGSNLVIDLRNVPELDRVGSAGAFVDMDRKVDIIVAHTASHRYVALDRSCTHAGAQCTYNHKRQTLQCTSLNHAEYDLKGTLLHGRTHGNLRTYEARRSGSLLEIRLARKDQ
jgi:nitrite reductase/ring-hydroxylating ferredoxin subunit